jgi:NAD(P)-dependent dehydrogenase (short-subunit alcohol dehydrogenase family)
VHSATKAAVRSLAQTLSAELAPRGIRVNLVAPGPTETALWQNAGLPADRLKTFVDKMKQRTFAGTFVSPADVAEAAVFLASESARHICGQEIIVDGGYTAG